MRQATSSFIANSPLSKAMGLLHREQTACDYCHEKFSSYDSLVIHEREAHNHHVIKCHMCGKLFLHEKERLHHEREEKEKKIDARRHKF
jgi:hypothetical protein